MDQDPLKTRKSLIERIRDRDDQKSWREFFNTYWKLIYGTALKAGLSREEAEEVVQETMITVTNMLDGFEYDPDRSTFKNWLLHKTRWRIIDQVRKRPKVKMDEASGDEASSRTPLAERIADPESLDYQNIWEEEWQKNLMDVALSKVKKKVKARQYQIFDLYVLKNWPVAEIRKTLKISATQVYVAKHRISGLLKKEVKRIETAMEQSGQTQGNST
jgi:RNA polymerase sigma factor (sigma-70 family)